MWPSQRFATPLRETSGYPVSTAAQAATTASLLEVWLPKGLVIVGLVAVLYAPVLKLMVMQWWQDPNYGHGFLAPLFASYVLYERRHSLREITLEPRNLGLLVMFGALGFLLAGTLGAELYLSRMSLLLLLSGMLLFLCGWNMLRALAFPLAYLVLMIPLPAIIFNQITFPLQLVASRLSSGCLELLGVPVLREGNVLLLPNYALEVVEACSGIRSLLSLIALAVAYGYLAESRIWVRIALTVLMLPIAVASNAMRVVGTGVLTYHLGPQSAEGFFHVFSGWLIFVAAVLFMLRAHWTLNHLSPPERKQSV